MTLMSVDVVLKQTHAEQPVGLRTRQLFARAANIRVAGIITNGNSGEILLNTKNPIFHMGDKKDLDQLVKRYRRDRQRIHDIGELDPSRMTLVDTDFDPFCANFQRNVFQHWTNGVKGRSIYFDEKETDSTTAVVERGSVISAYLVLSKLKGIIERAFVNIVKTGAVSNPKSKEHVEGTLRRVLGKEEIMVTGYASGVRYYDIMMTVFAKRPITQEQIGEMLKDTPRLIVERAEWGMHDIPKIEVDAIRNGRLRPPVIACITNNPEASTIQEIRLSTEARLVVAAANMDAVQILSGINMQQAMMSTDCAIGIRN